MPGFEDYANHDAMGLAELVRRKEVSPIELVETALSAIETLNPRLHAVTTVLEEQARAAAESVLPEGPFTGVPFLLKDLVVSYAGLPTNCGSRFFAGWTRDFDSEILRRWKRAGLIVIGKTNTPELGSSGSTEPVATGATHNPWNPDHTPGGSSGGSATAAADRQPAQLGLQCRGPAGDHPALAHERGRLADRGHAGRPLRRGIAAAPALRATRDRHALGQPPSADQPLGRSISPRISVAILRCATY